MMIISKCLLLLSFILPFWTGFPQGERPLVENPSPDEVLQGVVTILGSTDLFGFQSAEISFGYQSDATDTWFLIEQGESAINDDTLAIWDTTTITDGDYKIRVRVYLDDGTYADTIIPRLHVRNYSPIIDEQSYAIPTSAVSEDESIPEETAIKPTSTVLPGNPASISSSGIISSLIKGIVFAILAMIIIGAFFVIRAMVRRR